MKNYLKKYLLVIGIVVVAISSVIASLAPQASQAQDGTEFTYAGTIDAPDFPADLEWLNVTEPLQIEDLRGKILLLDFWTYGCINCVHVIPDLKQLEAEYPDELVVIGVHSAKFENEGDTDNIRQIVQRYGVTHPVVNDNEFEIWRMYNINAWPTLVLIDPNGKYVGSRAGEGVYEVFKPIVDIMAQEYDDAGLIDRTPLSQLAPEIEAREMTALFYPGKVLADVEGNRLIVSDSSHHRLVISTLDTFDNVQIIGTGEAGFVDGDFATAQFNSPQGLAIDGDTLYVADTNNHSIRMIDLAAQTVSTVVGTGEQASTYPPQAGTAPDVELSSPWDLVLHEGILYIAMAGSHQLWRINLESGLTEAHAGNGRENLTDGTLTEALMAQPSGIDTDGERLYFADSEASAIRTADIATDGEVTTIVGTGLFDFGDVDGIGEEVRLEHPLGVAVASDGLLYIADTYNNKIKTINPETRESKTFAGTGETLLADGALDTANFYEPGGIDYADGKLYVADTNNHVIRVIDLEAGTVSTVIYQNATVLLPEVQFENPFVQNTTNTNPFGGNSEIIQLAPMEVAPGEGLVVLDIVMPEGYKINDLAPFTAITPSISNISVGAEWQEYRNNEPIFPIMIPVTFSEGLDELVSDVTVYWCEAIKEELCFSTQFTFKVPVTVDADVTGNTITLPKTLVPPVIQDSLP